MEYILADTEFEFEERHSK